MMTIPMHFNKEKNAETYPGIHFSFTKKNQSHFDPQIDSEVVKILTEQVRRMRKDISKERNVKARMCLVLSPNSCIYLEENHEFKSDRIPIATTLINPLGSVISIDKSNYQVPVVYESY